jgi:TolB protein
MKTLAFSLALLCSLLTTSAAEATWPGANGSIVFSRTAGAGLNSGSDIWLATPSGAERRLTASPDADETAATFSPDGRTIAYVRRQNGDADIWLMRSDGSGKRPLVAGELDEFQPTFFPSGRSLAYTVYDGERGWTIYTVRRDGTKRHWLVQNASFPIASPKGRLLAYSSYGDGGGVHLLNLRTRKARRLTTGSAQELDFSPNGRRILFTGQRRCKAGGTLRFQLLVIGLSGRHARFLTRRCGSEGISGTWSPNGARILYTRKTQRGRALEFRLRMLTTGGAPAFGAPHHVRGKQEYYPDWQPLG